MPVPAWAQPKPKKKAVAAPSKDEPRKIPTPAVSSVSEQVQKMSVASSSKASSSLKRPADSSSRPKVKVAKFGSPLKSKTKPTKNRVAAKSKAKNKKQSAGYEDEDQEVDVNPADMAKAEELAKKYYLAAVNNKMPIEGKHIEEVAMLAKWQDQSTRTNVLSDGEKIDGCAVGMVLWRNGHVDCSRKTEPRRWFTKLLNKAAHQAIIESGLDEDFRWTSIQFNKDYASKAHKDDNNRGPSYIFGCGSYGGSGGETVVHKLGALDIYDKWVKFNGRHVHQTTPFSGHRFSFVFFSIRAAHKCKPDAWKTLESFGFQKKEYQEQDIGDDGGDSDIDDEIDSAELKRAKDRADKRVKSPVINMEIDRVQEAFSQWAGEVQPVPGQLLLIGSGYEYPVPCRMKLVDFNGNLSSLDIAVNQGIFCVSFGVDLKLPSKAKVFNPYKGEKVAAKELAKWIDGVSEKDVIVLCVSDTALKRGSKKLLDGFPGGKKQSEIAQYDVKKIIADALTKHWDIGTDNLFLLKYRTGWLFAGCKKTKTFATVDDMNAKECCRLVSKIKLDDGCLKVQRDSCEMKSFLPDHERRVYLDRMWRELKFDAKFDYGMAEDVNRLADSVLFKNCPKHEDVYPLTMDSLKQNWSLAIVNDSDSSNIFEKSPVFDALEKWEVDKNRCFVFSREEVDLPAGYENKVIMPKDEDDTLIRDFVPYWFRENTHVVVVSSLLHGLEVLNEQGQKQPVEKDFTQLVHWASDTMIKEGEAFEDKKAQTPTIWSGVVSHLGSTDLYKSGYSRKLGLIPRQFYGIIAKKDFRTRTFPSSHIVDDVERSIRYFRRNAAAIRLKFLRVCAPSYDASYCKQQIAQLTKIQNIFQWFICFDEKKENLKPSDLLFYTEGASPVVTGCLPHINGDRVKDDVGFKSEGPNHYSTGGMGGAGAGRGCGAKSSDHIQPEFNWMSSRHGLKGAKAVARD